MENFTTQDLIEELQQYHQPTPARREGGVTIGEWAKAQNISIRLAGKQLDELVEQGMLVKEFARTSPQGRGYVYYKA